MSNKLGITNIVNKLITSNDLKGQKSPDPQTTDSNDGVDRNALITKLDEGASMFQASNIPNMYASKTETENAIHLASSRSEMTKFCEHRFDGQYAAPFDCVSFIVCANGKSRVRQCPFGLRYNSQDTVCDWPQHVTCMRTLGGSSGSALLQGSVGSEQEEVYTKRYLSPVKPKSSMDSRRSKGGKVL